MVRGKILNPRAVFLGSSIPFGSKLKTVCQDLWSLVFMHSVFKVSYLAVESAARLQSCESMIVSSFRFFVWLRFSQVLSFIIGFAKCCSIQHFLHEPMMFSQV